MTHCSVSVVVPAFNRLEPLKYTLRSIARALRAWNEPGELILVDDGSQPPLQEVLADFDAGIAIRHLRQVNSGSIVARCHGLREAAGEFVLFVDSDDLIHPDKLCAQIPVMRAAAADVSYSGLAAAVLGEDFEVARYGPSAPAAPASNPADLYLTVQPAPHAPVYRRDYLNRCLAHPVVAAERRFDPVGDAWLYYNLAPHDAAIMRVDQALSAAGPHEELRYSHHWERLAISALWLAEAFFRTCPQDEKTRYVRQVAGEAAFNSWRRLPRDFDRLFQRRMMDLWRKAPHGEIDRLGGPLFRRLAALLGTEKAGRLLRLRNHDYRSCRTLGDKELHEFTVSLRDSAPGA